MSNLHVPARGYTLVELMVSVAIIGVLLAVGTPLYGHYVRKARTSEAAENLAGLYRGATVYYREARTLVTPDGLINTERCTAAGTARLPAVPSAAAQQVNFITNTTFAALNFSVPSPVRFGYSVVSTGSCEAPVGDAYTFRAEGDLDDDGVLSTFDLAVGVNASWELYRSPGVHVTDELE